MIFPCSADHVQNWQPYPVDPFSRYIHTYIHTYMCDRTYIISSRVHIMFRPSSFLLGTGHALRTSCIDQSLLQSIRGTSPVGFSLPSKSVHTNVASCIVVSVSPASPALPL